MLPTAKEFRRLRKHAGLTQKQVAELTGLSQSLIARIEKGDINTRLSTAQKILDVLREVPKKTKVLELRDIMHSPVIYCKSSDLVRVAVRLMEESGISQLPVMEDEKSVGSIVDTDLVMLLAKKGKRISTRKVKSVMSKPFPPVPVDSPMDRVVPLLSKNPAVLVTREGHIAGIVTKADVLKLTL